jgi:putative tricarboxylic transport membrane protein
MKNNLFRDADVIAGGLTAALGVYITMTALRWDVMGPEGPGPGFFPVGYGIALVILSLILIFQRFTAKAESNDTPFDWASFRRAAFAWLTFTASVALMPSLGFYISLGLLTLVLSLTIFAKPFKAAILNGVLSAAGFYIIFDLALDVSLPSGVLGF